MKEREALGAIRELLTTALNEVDPPNPATQPDESDKVYAAVREALGIATDVERIHRNKSVEQKQHEGREAYKELSRALNSGVTPEWLIGFMAGFADDHPTLQAKLYRELNTAMRLRHRFEDGITAEGMKYTECTDGRVAGDLPAFIAHGYIPFI